MALTAGLTIASLWRPVVITLAKRTRRARRRARGRSRQWVRCDLLRDVQVTLPKLFADGLPRVRSAHADEADPYPTDLDVSFTLKGFDPAPLQQFVELQRQAIWKAMAVKPELMMRSWPNGGRKL